MLEAACRELQSGVLYCIRNDTVIIDRIGPRGDVYKGEKRK